MGQFTTSPSYIVPCALGDKGSAIFGASLGLRYNCSTEGTARMMKEMRATPVTP